MNSWQDVKDYCESRLQEIREINKGYSCPSAFVCIAAFIGFLSRLAFGTNLAQTGSDHSCFCTFVRKYMPPKYNPVSELLYKTFRCGLVHAMSFDPEITDSRAVYLAHNRGGTHGYAKLAITHDTNLCSLCSGGQLQKDTQTGMYVLVADVLCDDLSSAIDNMFKDQAVRNNSEEFVRVQRPIQGISRSIPAVSCQNSSLSSSVDLPTINNLT